MSLVKKIKKNSETFFFTPLEDIIVDFTEQNEPFFTPHKKLEDKIQEIKEDLEEIRLGGNAYTGDFWIEGKFKRK